MKKTVKDINVQGKRVIVRCDFNVPMKEGVITDDIRIVSALPTVKYLMEQGAKVILMSHMGRPEGEPNMKYTLKPVADRLTELLGQEVLFVSSPVVVDEAVKAAAAQLEEGRVMLLENVRFRKEETKNGADFAKELASLADIFVNDAFGTAHRAHSSTAGVADYLPAVSGFLIEKEVEFLGNAVENPKRPFVAIMGGAKVGDKIPVIENLLKKVDTLIIGGGMSYTFYKAEGLEIGTSILDKDSLEIAPQLLKKAEEAGVKMLLPVDVVVADEFNNDAKTAVVDKDAIPAD
ncbi:MAG: phosphoglycerate kinase, partial [Firmicutes bacterium]|nr:phosphoglycerate kinase [Bacillota bacterium]